MKSIPPETAWLVDIAAACERIISYLRGVDKSAFLANSEKRYAIYAQLIIIGEAASRFSAAYRDAHPTIPWRKMIGMRNRIIHEYDSIDWKIVWDTATMHIPGLISALQPFLPAKENE